MKHFLVFLVFTYSLTFAQIAIKDTIVFGSDKYYPPYEFLDDNGKPAGFNIDLMKAIADEMGFTVVFKLGDWDKIRRELEVEGTVDVSDMFYSEIRDSVVDFAIPHEVMYDALFIRNGTQGILSLTDLKGKSLAVQRASSLEEFIRENHPEIKLVLTPTEFEALSFLSNGKCDAALVSQTTKDKADVDQAITNIIQVGRPVFPREYCFVVAEGNQQLLRILNAGIVSLKESGKFEEIRNNWFENDQANKVVRILIIVFALIGLIFIVFLIWNYVLAKKVKERTQKLKNEIQDHHKTSKLLNENIEKQTKEHLRTQLILETMMDGYILADVKAKIVDVNPAYCEMVGYTKDELLKMTILDLEALLTPEQVGEKIQAMLKEGSSRFESSHRHKDGRLVNLDVSISILNLKGESLVAAFVHDITERKKSEKEIRESRNRMANVLENMNDAFVSLDRNWCYTFMNDKAGNIFNRKPEDMIGKHIWTEFPEGVGQPFQKNYEKAMNEKIFIQIEEYYPPYDKWFENRINPTDYGIAIFFTDITERKKNEQALEDSEERLKLAQSVSNIGSWDYDIQSQNLTWSDQAFVQFGLNPNEYEPSEELFKSFVHPDDLPLQVLATKKSFDENLPYSVELRMLRNDGSEWYMHSEGKVIRDDNGNPLRFIGIQQDITERKKSEEKLQEQQNFIHKILDTEPGIVYIYDLEEQRNTYVNKHWLTEYGYSQGETEAMGDQLPSKVFHPDDLGLIARHHKDWQTTDTNKIGEIEYRIKAKNGRWYWLHARETAFSYNNEGIVKQILGIAHDVTIRKVGEDLIKKQNEQYDQLVQNIPVGIYKFRIKADSTMAFEYVSPVLCEICGVEAEEVYLNFMAIFSVIHPDELDDFINLNLEVAKTLDHFLWEGRAIVGGQTKWLRIESQPKLMENGDVYAEGILSDITDRKQAEIKLDKAATDWISTFDSTSDGVCLLNKDFEISQVNKAMCEIFSMTDDEVIGRKSWQVVHNSNEPPTNSPSLKMKETLERESLEKEIGGCWFLITVDPILSNKKELLGAVHIMRNISEQKKSENELRESEERYGNIVEHSFEGIGLINDNYTFSFVNDNLAKLFGYPKSEVIGADFRKFLAPESVEFVADRYKRRQKGEKVPPRYEVTLLKKNGEITFAELSSSVVLDKVGLPQTVVQLIDITEQKLAQDALRESEARNRAMLEAIPDLVFLNDKDGVYLDYRAKKQEKLFIKPEIFLGKKMQDILPDELLVDLIPLHKECLLTGRTQRIEYSLLIQNKMKYFDARLAKVEGDRVLTISREITESKKAEEELKNSFEQLRKLTSHLQTIREEERKNIAREIHDEFGQILSGIKMNLTLMSKEILQKKENVSLPGLVEELNSMKNVIDDSSSKLKKLITMLRPEILDHLGFESAVEWFLEDFEQNTKAKTILEGTLGNIELSKELEIALFRILQESLTNVRKHSEATEVKVVFSKTKKNIKMIISDNGKGFDFDINKNAAGYGILGMKERAVVFDGTVVLESRPGKGTKLTVSVPV